MTWITIRLKTTTPLFNEGFDPDDTTGIRVPSIRGAMRFWLRAMLGAVLGDDLDALRQWESRVLGRATTPNDHASSPLQIRIAQQPSVVKAGEPSDWLPSHGRKASQQGDDRWLVYLAGPGLADARTCTLLRQHVPPDQPIELKLRMRRADNDALSLALGALWLTCQFGGVGARTRRGFGGLRITDIDWDGTAQPPPWDRVPLTGHPVHRPDELSLVWPRQITVLIEKATTTPPGRLHQWHRWPPFPVLGPPGALPDGQDPTALARSASAYSSWSEAMQVAGLAWRLFRASDHSTAHLRGPYTPYVKTPEWREVVMAATPSDEFALGALGLPVIYSKTIAVNLFADKSELRRSSPIWIRPAAINGQWHVLTFGFRSRAVPDHATPVLTNDATKRAVTITDDDLDSALQSWTSHVGQLPAAVAELMP